MTPGAGAPHEHQLPAGGSLAPLLAVCAGYFMVILDVTAINVAVPVLGRGLGASLTAVQWVTNGYTLTFAVLLLTGGALGDRLGNRWCSVPESWSSALHRRRADWPPTSSS